MAITSKAQYFELWNQGQLGNMLRNWRSLLELVTSDYTGLVSIRYLDPGYTNVQYGVPKSDVVVRIEQLAKDAASKGVALFEDKLVFNEAAPDERLLIQGELIELPGGLALYYSTIPDRMRVALAKGGKNVFGLTAKMILNYYLDTNSLEDIRILLDTYPGHVIEFSTYSIELGNIPHRNTIIWEVRSY